MFKWDEFNLQYISTKDNKEILYRLKSEQEGCMGGMEVVTKRQHLSIFFEQISNSSVPGA